MESARGFPFLIYMYLYCFDFPFIGGRGKNGAEQEKNFTYFTFPLLIHKVFSFARLLERFTTGLKSVHLNETFSSPHFLFNQKLFQYPLSHTQIEEIILYSS